MGVAAVMACEYGETLTLTFTAIKCLQSLVTNIVFEYLFTQIQLYMYLDIMISQYKL